MSGAPSLHEIECAFDHHLRPQYYRRLLLPFAIDGDVADLLLTAWDSGPITQSPNLELE